MLNYYSYVDYNNLCETANFISLSPLPLILSIYYLYKNKGQNKNILYLSIFCLLLMVIVIIPLPDIFYKLTFSSSFHFSRVNIVINYINLLLFFLLLINNFKLNKKEMSIITILCIILILLSNVIVLNYYNYYLLLIATIMLFMIGIMAFDKNKQKLCLLILLFFNFISVFDVNPIARGTSVLHEKPFAKKVREIVAIDKDAKWITLNDLWLQNYLAANGAKTINTVNYYPNIDLWKKIDSNLEHAEVYNRYAHIQIIPSDETAFTIINRDAINVYLTYADLKQLNVKYIATSLEIEPDVGYPVEIRYCSENMYIYEVK